jgi:tRNA threonylcarbamoyladenosine biosynthesis protein TsaE
MAIFTLQEGDWRDFIQKNILSLCLPGQSAYVFALVGDLGAGKTTFSKAFLKEIGVERHVQSPTFSIINSYDIDFNGFSKAFHVDTYRIEDNKELEVLHFADILENPQHIVVIEWADKIRELIPDNATWMTFEHHTTLTRTITIHNGTEN